MEANYIPVASLHVLGCPPMQESTIPPSKVTRAHLGRWVISPRPRPLTSVLHFLFSPSHPPRKPLLCSPGTKIAQVSRLFFLPSCLQAIHHLSILGRLFFRQSHRMYQRMSLGSRNIS
ncbi:hypothetical protein FJTKL_07299 [Diaporthe vaccinii]|uniref:Uncharacterized protein n=1 Tax=Diaporthe vaccinii TaxID=105482 RepID=A0ABR4EUF8_9PEZI